MATKITQDQTNMKKTKMKRRKTISRRYGIAFCVVYLILIVLLGLQIVNFNILPGKYLIPLIVLIVLFSFGLAYLQLGRKISRVNQLLGRIIIGGLCVMLGFGNFFLLKTSNGLNKIADSKNTTTISIVTLKDSKVSSLSDLKRADFGRSESGTQSYIVKGLADVESELGTDVEVTAYTIVSDLVDDLYNGKIDAIVLEEGTRGLYTDAIADFTEKTKVVWSKSYEKETEENTKGVSVTEESFNVYITGIDTYGTVDTEGRSDVNMIVSINPVTHQVLMTSIPRDYYIPQTCQSNQEDKLTHTGMWGVKCTLGSVENYFNIDLNYYLKVNFSGITNIITAIGDIEVDNPFEFTGSGGGSNYHFEKGKIMLNADQALSYARERQSFLADDSVRIQNQSRVLEGVIKKVTSPSILSRYAGLVDALSDSFQTNMSRNEINALVKMQINDMPGWKITQISVTGEDQEGVYSPANGSNAWVMSPYDNSVKEAVKIINSVLNGEDVTKAVETYKEKNFVTEEVIDPYYYDPDEGNELTTVTAK